MDPFPKESRETKVESIVITSSISSSSESLDFFAMVHQVTPSVSSFIEC